MSLGRNGTIAIGLAFKYFSRKARSLTAPEGWDAAVNTLHPEGRWGFVRLPDSDGESESVGFMS
jgi:hypothetical protein